MRYLDQLRADPRVASVSDERATDDGYWVALNPGWLSETNGCQTVHEYTVEALRRAMKTVTPVTPLAAAT